ncbi:MAG: HesA/MoeB/ThiF family protein, partial [Lentisphaeria bacterium]
VLVTNNHTIGPTNCNNDTVALDNLHRQILYSTDNLSTPKVEAAKGEIARRNPEVIVETHQSLLNRSNARQRLKKCDIVLDATDNFPVRLVIADTCHELKVPYVHAGVQRFHGQAITVIPGETTCYRCIFPHAPPAKAVPSCAETGILGPVAGFFSTVQATEALKYLTGTSGLLTDRLLTADLLNWKVRIIPKKRQPHCPLCGKP